MPLSEYEQRMLEQMERQLRSDDPKLADALGSRRASGSRVLLGVVVLIAGMGMLVGGVALQSLWLGGIPWLGIAGFLAMFGGVWIALAKPRQRGVEGAPAGRGRPPVSSGPSRPSFMQRLEERWDRRRDTR